MLAVFPSTNVDAKSRKVISGIPNTIRASCLNGPPTEDELHERVEYGDKVKVKVSAYHEKEDATQNYSPEVATQEILVGRSNIPAFNDHLQGMCPDEIRRVFTWINPKLQAGPLAYMVTLDSIVTKKHLQEMDEAGTDEL